MSGHSKWSTIKRKKAAADAKRGKIFTKLLREIQVAARLGGGNIEGNARLKAAVQAAKEMSVPSDNIDRAIKRGSGAQQDENYEEVIYEGYGPGGVAVLVRALTDNRHRTASEVRHAFTKGGGSLGSTNSVAYLFHERAAFQVPKTVKEEMLFDIALAAGAEDIIDEGEYWEVLSKPEQYEPIQGTLKNLHPEISGTLRSVPSTTVKLSRESAKVLLDLLESLDDLDDVQSVVANFEIDDELLAAL